MTDKGWDVQQTINSGQSGSIMAETDTHTLFIIFDMQDNTASLGVNEKE
ncbi:MAG: hypothetical protein N3A72_09080 [bacterium]|nr:hypothetical protein [bacterium]